MLNSVREKYDVIARIQQLSRERLASPLSEQLVALSRQFYLEMEPQALASGRCEALYAEVLSLLQFISDRQAGDIRLRGWSSPDGSAGICMGGECPGSVIELVMEDCPYLLSTLSLVLQQQGIRIYRVVHPVVSLVRDGQGRLLQVSLPGEQHADGRREAVIRFELEPLSEGAVEQLLALLRQSIDDLRQSQADLPRMQEQLLTAADRLASNGDEGQVEAAHYLRWLSEQRFELLGYACYDLEGDTLTLVEASRLGILRFERHFPTDKKRIELPAYIAARMRSSEPLILTKSTYRCPVIRTGCLDYVGVKRFDTNGQVIGEHRFFGLYNGDAYRIALNEVPLLRVKVTQLDRALAIDDSSHRGRQLQQILDHYPRDEMLQTSAEELEEILRAMLETQDRPRVRLLCRRDVHDRFITALVLVPRERYHSGLCQQLQQLLVGAFDADDIESRLWNLDGLLVTLQFTVHTRNASQRVIDTALLEREMARQLLTWQEQLAADLNARKGWEEASRLMKGYGDRFPAVYRAEFAIAEAVRDIERFDRLGPHQPLLAELGRQDSPESDCLRFDLYGMGPERSLSSLLPVLENLGLDVLSAHPYRLDGEEQDGYWRLTFDLCGVGMAEKDSALRQRFEEAFIQTCRGVCENDGYNRLVLAAALSWREALVFRAFGRYLSQIGLPFSQSTLQQALAQNPAITLNLSRLFARRFDPVLAERGDVLQGLVNEIEQALESVDSLDQDRILRAFLAVVQATVRTNYYQRMPDGGEKEYLAFKIQPQTIPETPQPCPAFEIFVYSPRVEGVHLRGGKVARGGLRWSDRRDDYRTEVLGLLKAQMVKNAVIVPTGSKGGFYCKQMPLEAGREATQAEAQRCYATFIRGLLDLTDNLIDGQPLPLPDVVCHDETDPYLVVAADKGTATFSDIANGIAEEYRFWLGDAFASGGANGYDHKRMGITARGAWESVKRLFLELGRDCQQQPFTVVGIGDMSGDVFGNGMLLSRQTHLVAAFNHQHIFIDPTPDAQASFAERERLFRLPGSSWADYDTACISAGGGVFSRRAKQIRLTAPIRQVLQIDASTEVLTPNALIKAILSAPVDLLWNGGIGTYVKASTESHDSVGDRANDTVRIDASQLRCKVIGEGGNLGLTQLARIEFARRGGLINTDAIDNSGGVDCSDHEVNIKILLRQIQLNGQLDGQARNRLLASMADDVAQLVLNNNQQQALLLSLAAGRAGVEFDSYRQLAQSLEQSGRLNPALEGLPDWTELEARAERGEGYTRPELAVLSSYAKVRLSEELGRARLADNPFFAAQLPHYFPLPIRQQFGEQIAQHPLRHEILATDFANRMVNRLGGGLCQALLSEYGCSAEELLCAYMIASDLVDADNLWMAINALGISVAYPLQQQLLQEVRTVLVQTLRWLLDRVLVLTDMAAVLGRLRPAVAEIVTNLEQLLSDPAREQLRGRTEALLAQQVPASLAEQLATLCYRLTALNIARVSERTGTDLALAASACFLFSAVEKTQAVALE